MLSDGEFLLSVTDRCTVRKQRQLGVGWSLEWRKLQDEMGVLGNWECEELGLWGSLECGGTGSVGGS